MAVVKTNTIALGDKRHTRGLVEDVVRRFVRNPVGMLGFAITSILVICAIFGPSIAPYPPNDLVNFDQRFAPPSIEHPFGLDNNGRDQFSRILHGARGIVDGGCDFCVDSDGGGDNLWHDCGIWEQVSR